MTALLETVFNRLKELPEEEQDLLATYILEKLESKWDEEIATDFSKDGPLYWMLQEARQEYAKGNTNLGGFDGN